MCNCMALGGVPGFPWACYDFCTFVDVGRWVGTGSPRPRGSTGKTHRTQGIAVLIAKIYYCERIQSKVREKEKPQGLEEGGVSCQGLATAFCRLPLQPGQAAQRPAILGLRG